ncbi:MAG: phosphate ABC transporter substrate-binding protein [Campylobacteraceae bacterium]|nr:phosphate ABC transporter substrate-binding protein [Campylobacteraceae bacterium]
MKFLKVVVASLLLASFANAEVKTEINFAGSSTLAPVVAKISDDFSKEYQTWDKVDAALPNKEIKVYVSSGGSGAGVKAVLDNTADFGMLARGLKDSEKEKLKDPKVYLLGMDALTIAVNPQNDVIKAKGGNLTKDEIVKIFSGEYKTWNDVDSSLPKDEIVIVTRDLAGGAHEVFQDNIMKDVKVSKNVIQAPSMGALVSKIIENKNAIGYASFGIANQNAGKLIPLKVDGIEPSVENIENGSYYVSRPLIVVKDGELSKTDQVIVDMLLSKKAKETIDEMGFLPSK